ncbi:hypothetical protein BX661DRAFT_182631 [Kickxella alabastrina]|uniref:uncharacterized protein n=1 Tax=Kickxella alabastrina TaxID=61397 RepID=UPI0022203E3B|nr:uncharacterized protein BX661DRAFT_182631 [Kickxella alabastrina]KAI7827873.1 hypothetical protein BX661DRAFT_182631 [Kickxella alabastrina]
MLDKAKTMSPNVTKPVAKTTKAGYRAAKNGGKRVATGIRAVTSPGIKGATVVIEAATDASNTIARTSVQLATTSVQSFKLAATGIQATTDSSSKIAKSVIRMAKSIIP